MADDLIRFVSFAGDQDGVSRLRGPKAERNRLATVRLGYEALAPGQDDAMSPPSACGTPCAWIPGTICARIEKGSSLRGFVGASGGIGPAVLQVARYHFGAEVAGVCGTARLEYIRSLGAHLAIDYTQEDFVDRAESYDVIIDILGKTSFRRCRRVLKPGGRLIFVSFKTKQILQALWTKVVGDKKAICALVTERQEDLVLVRSLVEAGVLTPVVDRSYPLDQAAEAHRYAESGARAGSVVIAVSQAATSR